jgi:hypothetical protein
MEREKQEKIEYEMIEIFERYPEVKKQINNRDYRIQTWRQSWEKRFL